MTYPRAVLRDASPFVLACTLLACGPSPAAPANAPSGTLVVVVRQGPARVPFDPKVARIQRANQDLARVLGHSIQIELDGALLPQTHDDAEDVIARLVESVARDLDALQRADPRAHAFARVHFERLVVRYAPGEAAAREDPWRPGGAKLDAATKTVDVARADARWLALERGEIFGVLRRAHSAESDARYADVMPASLPADEHRSWFDYHAHEARRGSKEKLGAIDALRVRGMVSLHRLALRANDQGLARDVRAWLIHAASDFASTYHHHAAEVESAPSDAPFHRAEAEWVAWTVAELPRMTIAERGAIATHLFVVDFRKGQHERDRFFARAFPGIDPMAFSADAVDAWIAAGRPLQGEPYFDHIVCPAKVERTDGRPRFGHEARCDGAFYRWALADRTREEALVTNMLSRGDIGFATAAFTAAHRTLRDEADYLRFLRRFELAPSLWKVGADVHREGVYRPSPVLLEESRRLWRERPATRGHALLWFARHIEGSYEPEKEWPDLHQGTLADEATLRAYLDLGWEAFELLPKAWKGIAKTRRRIGHITEHARELIAAGIRARPGGRDVAGTLAAIARLLCEENATSEVAELRAFALAELAKSPGAGLSEVVEATDPKSCVPPKPRVAPKPAPPRRSTLKPGDWSDR